MESSPGPHRGFAGGDGEAAASVGPLDWAVRVTGAAGWPPAVRRVALGASGPGSTVLGVQGLTGGAQALHHWVRSDGRALGGACCPQDQLALEGSLALASKVPEVSAPGTPETRTGPPQGPEATPVAPPGQLVRGAAPVRRGAPRPPHYCSAATPTTGPEPLCGGTFGNHRKVQREHKTHPDPTSGQQPCSLSVLSHQSETNSSQRSQKTEKQDLSASPPVPCSCPPAARPPRRLSARGPALAGVRPPASQGTSP